MAELANPFAVTKAGDFTDAQIASLWVDLPDTGGFFELIKPQSPMPMLVVGGKGCGKTHLLRYFSYPLQKRRCASDLLAGLKEEGYLGVYMRCEGLSASRFNGKGQTKELWAAVFEHYMELWLARTLLEILSDILSASPALLPVESALSERILSLFDRKIPTDDLSIKSLIRSLDALRQNIDYAVNNCAITRHLEVEITATRGRLIFGIPAAVRDLVPELKDLQFQFIVDEIENLNAPQQEYVNTLLRERPLGCSFKLGARKYGIRTLRTLSAGEENREGSEFEKLPLDEIFRTNPNYGRFARELIARRIVEAGFFRGITGDESVIEHLDEWFPPVDEIKELASKFVRFESEEKPYFSRLKRHLLSAIKTRTAQGIGNESGVEYIIQKLIYGESPLLEKVNVYLFYRAWFKNLDLTDAANDIARKCVSHSQTPGSNKLYSEALGHFKRDFIAQLYRECDEGIPFAGLETFITMSCGLPRNLLNILKHVYKWAVFNGETPFQSAISRDSQTSAAFDAAQWFYSDACTKGHEGPEVQTCVRKVAHLMREMRFADKPSESSVSTFSLDLATVTSEARKLIELAEQYSLLIAIPKGQKDKNSLRIDAKFQINPMLAPLWDLPISRRGTIGFNSDEVDSIFTSAEQGDFDKVLHRRIERMNAPTFGKRRGKEKNIQTQEDGRLL
ncbi:MAG: hypothetical protein ABJF10_08520 [Chthoniobacter sp.]|uniref:ORC-CDC6 family AAA ATPase n=1 Tax=Chthoniobacter sp. TaxID=2510640 RepID=UPI0032A1DD36